MIDTEQTQPLPALSNMLTLRQLHQQCQMSIDDLAIATGVRLCFLYWMEIGIAARRIDAMRVLAVLSRRAGRRYTLKDIYGLHIKEK